MTVISESVQHKQGFNLHVVPTKKYKTNTLVWKMKAPLDKETVTMRALLPHVIQNSTQSYPSTSQLRSYLDDLYGATLFGDLAKKGEYHVITISMEIANEKYLSDSTPLLRKAVELLSELLTNPNVDDGSFISDIIEKEKKMLKQRIQSVYDDKMRYSNSRLVEEMCKGEPFALHQNGILEKVDEITAKSLYEYFERAMKEDELDLYIIGDIDENEVNKMCNELLPFAERDVKQVQSLSKTIEKENEVIEEQDVKQGKLNIGYRTNIHYGDENYFALQLFNGIFGGFSHSKLFINVREKESLAYYAASRLESHKGLMMVMSGVDAQNYDKAVRIIKEQMEAMRSGDFTDGEIDQTKAVIKNQMLETIDTARGLVEVLYHNVVAKTQITLSDWLERSDQVTKQEVIDVANQIDLDTIYFLTGKGE